MLRKHSYRVMKLTTTFIKIFCVFFLLYFQSTSIIMAKSQTNVIREFKQALLKNDKKLMQSYVTEGVELPTFQTDKHIHEIKIVPSPKEDTTILISYFKDTDDEFTIGYILEIITKNNKISRINQIYDGTNPLMKEATIVKEYEIKCKEHILTPTKFPFEIHEFQGYIYNDYLELRYYNEDINGILKITVSPVHHKLDQYVHKGTEFYNLKHNIKAVYNPHFDLAYELIFQKDGFQYTIALGNKLYIKRKYNVTDLIRIAESMK
ncbi:MULTISPECIES: hypothetical protein [Bacillus]|uniref:DUF4367 domain-containing protein n=1 Tax=Bacillus wiedmannii TaxID=1890302 RepID=A0AB73SDM9_9BACI|nr:hypothetical protein [Bacillus wiedmannii]MDI6676819.1 hypothetical protein [Bacillus wiedmannii]PEK23108.1 hypothetical protein CN694_20265 [Bacillus wiedmannii]PHB69439.1 hypothetical protein COE89_22535 [Bacillus wiedmannii]HDR3490471.1 hypothetical protein [Bacillus wiedmannii]